MPTAEQRDGLGAAGRGFVARVLTDYVFTPMEGELILEAAQISDRLEQIRIAR